MKAKNTEELFWQKGFVNRVTPASEAHIEISGITFAPDDLMVFIRLPRSIMPQEEVFLVADKRWRELVGKNVLVGVSFDDSSRIAGFKAEKPLPPVCGICGQLNPKPVPQEEREDTWSRGKYCHWCEAEISPERRKFLER